MEVEGVEVVAAPDVSEEEIKAVITEEKERARKDGRQLVRVKITADGDELIVEATTTPPIRRIRRITGYLAPTDRWNSAKLAELRDRQSPVCRPVSPQGVKKTGVLLCVHGMLQESVVDGPGLRDVVFVQGCPHRCPGCQNPGSWDFEGGSLVDVADIISLIPSSPLISGVTFSGGEPLCQAKALTEIAKHVKGLGLNLWVYTGYMWEELMTLPDPAVRKLLSYTDVLVDGRYVREERDISLPFRGSRNQRLIDVQASLRGGRVVLWERDATAPVRRGQ
ncbi:MAG: anaerobic ribonucleoside-triphosphate reductase activating protein [Thermacetogeniaceae bacterium]